MTTYPIKTLVRGGGIGPYIETIVHHYGLCKTKYSYAYCLNLVWLKTQNRGLFDVCQYTNNRFSYFREFSLNFSFRKFLLRCIGWFSLKLWEVLVENKEINRNLYKRHRMKLMWVLGFYMWHLSMTTKLSEFIKCNVVILKKNSRNYRKWI